MYLVSFVLLLGVSVDIANAGIRSDLISYWKLNDGSGTTATDSAGINDGTLKGDPTWVDGWFVGAIEFDGNDDYVDCGQGIAFNSVCRDEVTLTAWVKADPDAGVNWGGIIFRGHGDQFGNNAPYDTFALYFDWSTNRLGFKTSGTSGSEWLPTANNAASDVVDGEWHHTAATYDGAEKVIYLDAVEIVRATSTGQISMGLGTGRILISGGRDVDPIIQEFHGIIDEVRIYNRGLTENEIQAVMEDISSIPYATGSSPVDGAIHPDTWVNISWRPGDFAVSHDVFFGDNFDAVNEGAEGTFVGNQAGTFIVVGFPGFPYPEGLVPGTTYYWRIDEVNETEPNSPWKGDVWSFSIPPRTAYFPVPADNAESVALDAGLSWTPGFGAKLHTVYFGDTFNEVDNAIGGQVQGTTTYTPDALELAKTYYWRVDEFDVSETHKGNVWSFTTEGAVGSPNPAKGAVDVTQSPVLTWIHGVFVDTHEIYFGADATSLEFKDSGNLGSESFEPGQLEWNTTYYWRVDEANNANAGSPWIGPLWSFTTANFLIIDDMESYNDINEGEEGSNRIYNAWVDGYDDPTNGSQTGHLDAPFYEETIVHSGNKSMPLYYDNAVGKSEATLTLTSNRDWTVKGVNTLTIWFRGSSNNDAEQMYVALNGNAVVTNDNPDAVQDARWIRWDIDLQAFADQGINLSNVTSITIGLGNRANPVAGGSGMMYYDDIRLHPPVL